MQEQMEVKQVLVVRRDLNVRRGKWCAQVAHASIAFMAMRLDVADTYGELTMLAGAFTEAEFAWIKSNFKKITLQVPDEEALLNLEQAARDAGLEAHLITDSGLTEFKGVPTKTALAIGPDWSDKIDLITGDLALY